MTTIADNQLYDGAANAAIGCPAGSTSYAIDLPNGGAGRIFGNQIIQGPNTENSAMVTYGEEGLVYTDNSLLVSDNSFTSSGLGSATGINDPSCVTVLLRNNTVQGVARPVNPAGCAVYLPVPEPGSWLPLLSGLVGYFVMCVRRRSPARSANR